MKKKHPIIPLFGKGGDIIMLILQTGIDLQSRSYFLERCVKKRSWRSSNLGMKIHLAFDISKNTGSAKSVIVRNNLKPSDRQMVRNKMGV